MKIKSSPRASVVLGVGILALVGCGNEEPSVCGTGAGNVKDEALCVRSYPRVPASYLPDFLQPLVGVLDR